MWKSFLRIWNCFVTRTKIAKINPHEQANNKFCLNCNQIAEWYRRKVEKSFSFLKRNHIILLGLNMFWNKSSPNRYYWYHTYQFCKYQICKYVHTYFLNVLFKPQRQHICQVQKRLTQESIWQKNERCGGLGVFFKNQTSSRKPRLTPCHRQSGSQ